MRLSLVSLCLLSLVACGGDDDGGNPMLVDAGPGSGGEDAPPVSNCKAAPSYSGTFNDQNGAAETGDGNETANLSGLAALNMDPDFLFVDLWEGYGVFTGGITTGTFTIEGDEASPADCGACVSIYADIVLTGNSLTAADIYAATGGTLTISSINDTFEWSLSNVTLQHVASVVGGQPTAVESDCTTTVTNATFNATIDAGQLRSKNGPIRLRAQRVTKR